MINTLYLVLIIIGISGQNVAKKPYTQKFNRKGSYFFIFLSSLSALAFFLFLTPKMQFQPELLPYSIAFALAYAVSSIFTILAIAYGSLSLSSLIVAYSLLIPTLYGIIFLNDPIGIGFFPGLAFLVISLFLINKTNDKAAINTKWVICAALAFVGNGMCTVIQKMQQLRFDGAYKSEFMIFALAIVCLVVLTASLFTERKHIPTYAASGWYLAVIVGLFNGMVNLLVMILSARMPISLMFPLISAGGLIVTYIISKFCYKEPLTTIQFIGFLLGITAVVFLNI